MKLVKKCSKSDIIAGFLIIVLSNGDANILKLYLINRKFHSIKLGVPPQWLEHCVKNFWSRVQIPANYGLGWVVDVPR